MWMRVADQGIGGVNEVEGDRPIMASPGLNDGAGSRLGRDRGEDKLTLSPRRSPDGADALATYSPPPPAGGV